MHKLPRQGMSAGREAVNIYNSSKHIDRATLCHAQVKTGTGCNTSSSREGSICNENRVSLKAATNQSFKAANQPIVNKAWRPLLSHKIYSWTINGHKITIRGKVEVCSNYA